jgi:hypothetical protein
MIKTILSIALLMLISSASYSSIQTESQYCPMGLSTLQNQSHNTGYCCKVCHKGKACGDSCISVEKECHQPIGCACDV